MVGKINSSEINVVEENLAELQRAVQVIETGDVDGVVAIGVRKGHKPKGLPEIDVNKVEADTYYRTKDGVLHLNEVKNTPNAFVDKLDSIRKKKKKNPSYRGQFERYADWTEEGAKTGQVRRAMVYIRNSEPNFHRILDRKVLNDLRDSLTTKNATEFVLQVENVKFNFNQLEKLTEDAYKKLTQLVEQEAKLQPDVSISKLYKPVLKKHFDSMEKTFETLGKTYGY